MTKSVSGTYETEDQLRNVRDDLLSSGITDEMVKVDEGSRRISVRMPDATSPNAREILERHELKNIREAQMT